MAKNKNNSENTTVTTTAGGPPGKKKVNTEVQKQLKKLIEGTTVVVKEKKGKPVEVVLMNPLSHDKPLSSNDIGKKNDAMDALVKGAEKRKAAKDGNPVKASAMALGSDLLKQKLEAFIDGPLKACAESFVRLYTSRATAGTAPEAMAALEACRVAFDACGFELADVETKKTKAAVKTEQPQPKAKKSKKGNK